MLQPANTTWTPTKSIEDMDRGGVAASIVSITNPGLWFGDAPMTHQLARACNDTARTSCATIRRGSVCLRPCRCPTSTQRSPRSPSYDTLKVDGIGLFTSYGDMWLGTRSFGR